MSKPPSTQYNIPGAPDSLTQDELYVTRDTVQVSMEAFGEQGKAIKGQNMTIMACNDTLKRDAGEYGELLVSGGKLLEGEEPLSVSEGDVVSLLESILNRSSVSSQCRNYALTALMKLSVRFASQADRIKVYFGGFMFVHAPPITTTHSTQGTTPHQLAEIRMMPSETVPEGITAFMNMNSQGWLCFFRH